MRVLHVTGCHRASPTSQGVTGRHRASPTADQFGGLLWTRLPNELRRPTVIGCQSSSYLAFNNTLLTLL